MKKVLSAFVALAMLGTHLASGQVEDGKRSSYEKFKIRTSSEGIEALIGQAEALKESSPRLALEKVKEALGMSVTNQNTVAEARCYILMGGINMDIQQWILAQENFRTAAESLKEGGYSNTGYYREALNGMGNAALKLNDFATAQSCFEQLLVSADEDRLVHAARLGLSEVHYQQGSFQNALEVLERGALQNRDPILQAREDQQRAKIFARLNQADRANRSFESSTMKLRSAAPSAASRRSDDYLKQSKEEISDVYQEKKLYDEEIDLRNQSIEYNVGANNAGEVSADKVKLGQALIAKGETAAAIRELQEAAFIADTIGDAGRQADAYLALATLYEDYGRTRDALTTFRKYSRAVARDDSLTATKLLEKSELIKTQRDIEELSRYISVGRQEEKLSRAMMLRQRLVIYGLVVIILIIGVTSYFIYKNARASRLANQLLALKSLRSQMNPHFLFNALNSVNQFISNQDERAANRYLSEFSRLMRLILENSQKDFIPLRQEEEIIQLYLKLEHYRFREKFDYSIDVDESIDKEAVEVPPMLIQPYIENAVWHGLRYKEAPGFLSVAIRRSGGAIAVEVTDDGIGRKRSAELKTEHQKKQQSTGLRNIRERLAIINEVYGRDLRLTIEDRPGGGTVVRLLIPLAEKIPAHA